MTAVARLTSDIVSAFVENNAVSREEVAALIGMVGNSIKTLGEQAQATEEPSTIKTKPQIKASIQPDYLVSFEDGKRYKTLRRHLAGAGLLPDEYRAKYGLPHDYPMVAAGYSAQRSELAKALGLGFSRRRKAEAVAAPAPKKRGRSKATA